MARAGMNMGQVKQRNRAAILQYINEAGPVSRKDIADETGLTPASVTQISTALLDEGILTELGTAEDEAHIAGRKKVLLDINDKNAYVYAVNIEPERTTVALSDLRGNVASLEWLTTERDLPPATFLTKIANLCAKLSEGKSDGIIKKIRAISVGITGIVDKASGVSVRAYGIWKEEVAVADILQAKLNLPVFLTNNVDAFSLAELLFGVGKKYDNLLIIKWGPGVGSTIVIDNKIYEGRHGKTAEIGHTIVEPDGKKCLCGRRGCLETKVSYRALKKIANFTPETFGEVYQSVKKKDRKEFDEAIDLFARTIVNAGVLMSPNRIVLEGNLLQSKVIRDRLIKSCKAYDEKYDENRIAFSKLFDREDYIGPVAVFFDKALDGAFAIDE